MISKVSFNMAAGWLWSDPRREQGRSWHHDQLSHTMELWPYVVELTVKDINTRRQRRWKLAATCQIL